MTGVQTCALPILAVHSAVETLADYWRKKFDPDATSECMDLISTLEQSDKLHSNNKEIIVWSKEFRTIARKYYTKDETTFLVFQNALKELYQSSVCLLLRNRQASFHLPISSFNKVLSIYMVLLCSVFYSTDALSMIAFDFLSSSSHFTPVILRSNSSLSFST